MPGSASRAATPQASSRPRSRRCGPAGATYAGSPQLATEVEAVEVIVGLPRSLSGAEGPAAVKTREFAARLARRVAPVPVRLCDERLTTVSAESMLRSQGRHGTKRRAVVDQAAAVLILQTALDTERLRGQAPGEIVEVTDE